MALAVTEANFEATIKRGIVVFDFWASWCAPCRAFAPVFEAAAQRHPDVTFAQIDTEAEAGLAAMFSVRSIPTIAILRDSILLTLQPGAMSARAIDELLDQVRALDMEEVERKAQPLGTRDQA